MPKMLKILTDDHDFLRKKVDHVENPTDTQISDIVNDMIYTMRKADGIGLAANQVGINARIVVIETKDEAMHFINPRITSISQKTEIGEEGCLSFPGIFLDIKRHSKITIQYQNIMGELIELDAEGLFARVLQHEIDHLNGIVFTEL